MLVSGNITTNMHGGDSSNIFKDYLMRKISVYTSLNNKDYYQTSSLNSLLRINIQDCI